MVVPGLVVAGRDLLDVKKVAVGAEVNAEDGRIGVCRCMIICQNGRHGSVWLLEL